MTSRTGTLLIAGALIALVLLPGSTSAVAIIQKFEGFRNKAYWDANGYAIGYGTHYNYDAGRNVISSDTIDQPRALKWLKIAIDENNRIIDRSVTIPISSNQRDSLLSFVYNIGSDGFIRSTLLDKLNAGRPKKEVAAEFDRWIYSNGSVNPTLVKRRAAEKALFLS